MLVGGNPTNQKLFVDFVFCWLDSNQQNIHSKHGYRSGLFEQNTIHTDWDDIQPWKRKVKPQETRDKENKVGSKIIDNMSSANPQNLRKWNNCRPENLQKQDTAVFILQISNQPIGIVLSLACCLLEEYRIVHNMKCANLTLWSTSCCYILCGHCKLFVYDLITFDK